MDTNKETNAIILRSSGMFITDNEEQTTIETAVVDIHKNIFDEAYQEIFGGISDPNQSSVADTKTTIAGSDAKLGETPTMDSGKYKLDADGGDPLSFLNDASKQNSKTYPVKKNENKNYSHILIIVVIIVFAIIFLKGLLK